MSSGKQPTPLDQVVHDLLDKPNTTQYYRLAEEELRAAAIQENLPESVIKEEVEKVQDSFRNFYHTSNILSHSKNNEFFDDIVRQMHPTLKIKGPIKNLLKTMTKVYAQELAEACLELMTISGKTEVDGQVVGDAYRLLEKRKYKNNRVASMFSYMH